MGAAAVAAVGKAVDFVGGLGTGHPLVLEVGRPASFPSAVPTITDENKTSTARQDRISSEMVLGPDKYGRFAYSIPNHSRYFWTELYTIQQTCEKRRWRR